MSDGDGDGNGEDRLHPLITAGLTGAATPTSRSSTATATMGVRTAWRRVCRRHRRAADVSFLQSADTRPMREGPVLRSGLSGRSRQCGEGCACVVGPVRCTPPLGDHDRVGEVAGSVGGAAEEHVELGERVSDGSHRE